jgi:hypothetical protein
MRGSLIGMKPLLRASVAHYELLTGHWRNVAQKPAEWALRVGCAATSTAPEHVIQRTFQARTRGLRQGREDSRRKTPFPNFFSGIYDTLNIDFNYAIYIITKTFQLITYCRRQR